MAAQRSRIYKRQHLDSMYYIIGKLLSCIIRADLPESEDMVQLVKRIGIQYELRNNNDFDNMTSIPNNFPDIIVEDSNSVSPSSPSTNFTTKIITDGENTIVKKRSSQEVYPNDIKELITLDCFDTIRNTQRCLYRLTLAPIASECDISCDDSQRICSTSRLYETTSQHE